MLAAQRAQLAVHHRLDLNRRRATSPTAAFACVRTASTTMLCSRPCACQVADARQGSLPCCSRSFAANDGKCYASAASTMAPSRFWTPPGSVQPRGGRSVMQLPQRSRRLAYGLEAARARVSVKQAPRMCDESTFVSARVADMRSACLAGRPRCVARGVVGAAKANRSGRRSACLRVGRSVITWLQFWSEPFAYALEDWCSPLSCRGTHTTRGQVHAEEETTRFGQRRDVDTEPRASGRDRPSRKRLFARSTDVRTRNTRARRGAVTCAWRRVRGRRPRRLTRRSVSGPGACRRLRRGAISSLVHREVTDASAESFFR